MLRSSSEAQCSVRYDKSLSGKASTNRHSLATRQGTTVEPTKKSRHSSRGSAAPTSGGNAAHVRLLCHPFTRTKPQSAPETRSYSRNYSYFIFRFSCILLSSHWVVTSPGGRWHPRCRGARVAESTQDSRKSAAQPVPPCDRRGPWAGHVRASLVDCAASACRSRAVDSIEPQK